MSDKDFVISEFPYAKCHSVTLFTLPPKYEYTIIDSVTKKTIGWSMHSEQNAWLCARMQINLNKNV